MANDKKTDEGKNGIPTEETKILTCQCGSTAFDVKKRTATSVSLSCAKCGLKCSVKGNIATVRVRQQEIAYAIQNTVVAPDPNAATGGSSGKGGGGSGQTPDNYGMWKVRLAKNTIETVVRKAFECIRIQNCSDDKFREQTWQGHALEFICADFLSGCPHEVLQIFDAMEAAEEDLVKLAEKDGKKEPTARKIRDLRAKVRDKLAKESGILPADFFGSDDDRQMDLPEGEDESEQPEEEAQLQCPECNATVTENDEQCPGCGVAFGTEEAEDEEAEDEEEEFKPVPDGGRLLKAVRATLSTYLDEAKDAEVDEDGLPEYLVSDGPIPSKELVEKWTSGGGYLVRIQGDERTIGGDETRAAVCAWVAAEPAELALDFGLEYDDATDDILGDGVVEVVELLPPDYDEIEQWAQPHFADRRETV